jgi:hypothetical protein
MARDMIIKTLPLLSGVVYGSVPPEPKPSMVVPSLVSMVVQQHPLSLWNERGGQALWTMSQEQVEFIVGNVMAIFLKDLAHSQAITQPQDLSRTLVGKLFDLYQASPASFPEASLVRFLRRKIVPFTELLKGLTLKPQCLSTWVSSILPLGAQKDEAFTKTLSTLFPEDTVGHVLLTQRWTTLFKSMDLGLRRLLFYALLSQPRGEVFYGLRICCVCLDDSSIFARLWHFFYREYLPAHEHNPTKWPSTDMYRVDPVREGLLEFPEEVQSIWSYTTMHVRQNQLPVRLILSNSLMRREIGRQLCGTKSTDTLVWDWNKTKMKATSSLPLLYNFKPFAADQFHDLLPMARFWCQPEDLALVSWISRLLRQKGNIVSDDAHQTLFDSGLVWALDSVQALSPEIAAVLVEQTTHPLPRSNLKVEMQAQLDTALGVPARYPFNMKELKVTKRVQSLVVLPELDPVYINLFSFSCLKPSTPFQWVNSSTATTTISENEKRKRHFLVESIDLTWYCSYLIVPTLSESKTVTLELKVASSTAFTDYKLLYVDPESSDGTIVKSIQAVRESRTKPSLSHQPVPPGDPQPEDTFHVYTVTLPNHLAVPVDEEHHYASQSYDQKFRCLLVGAQLANLTYLDNAFGLWRLLAMSDVDLQAWCDLHHLTCVAVKPAFAHGCNYSGNVFQPPSSTSW